MSTAVEKYLAPKEQPVFQLSSKGAWDKLTEKEKKYAHYISRGEQTALNNNNEFNHH